MCLLYWHHKSLNTYILIIFGPTRCSISSAAVILKCKSLFRDFRNKEYLHAWLAGKWTHQSTIFLSCLRTPGPTASAAPRSPARSRPGSHSPHSRCSSLLFLKTILRLLMNCRKLALIGFRCASLDEWMIIRISVKQLDKIIGLEFRYKLFITFLHVLLINLL